MERFYPNLDLKFLANCPLCNNKYDPKEIKIVDKKDGAVVLYFSCSRCKSSIVSAVTAGILGVSAVSMVTDLGESEIGKIKNIQAITSNDVLEIYNLFKNR